MKSTMKRAIAIISALVLTATMFSGCRGDSDEYSVFSVIEYVGGEDNNDSSKNNNSSGDTQNNSNGDSQNNSNGDSNNNTSNSTDNNNSGKVNPADYKGTKVVYATWDRSEGTDTTKILNSFKNKYGITVEIKRVPQATYIQEVTSLIQSGNAPDVIKDCCYFPAFTTIAQPLENAKIDFTDPIWDQNFLKLAMINGKHYSLNTVGPMFQEQVLVYYNKKLLNSNGIRTPEDYKAINQWNFDAVYKIMKDVSNLGKNYFGAYADYLGYCIAPSFGTDIFKYSNGKFSSGTGDAMLSTIGQMISKWNAEGLMANARKYFIEGKCGLAFTGVYGLKKNGYWKDMNAEDIGYIEMPSLNGTTPNPTGTWQGYGICKSAKNPIAGGIFLRYYLDSGNYDIASEYITSDAATFCTKITSSSNSKYYSVGYGVSNAVGIDSLKYYIVLSQAAPAQIPQTLSSMSNEVNNYVKQAQNILNANTK